MINWRQGGWAGSVNRWVRREVRNQLRRNPAARRSRYNIWQRILRCFFSIGTFGRFISLYIALNLIFAVSEAATADFLSGWLPTWMALDADSENVLLNVSSYLITAQVGALGVISLALALVTLIAQRENSATDIKIYYHESLAFEVVASCIALLAVLCAQLLWPAQLLLHGFGFGSELGIFKFGLFGIHLFWLLINLGGLAQFIATTFGFVQQSARESLRERYTANVVQPREMTRRLRQQLYGLAAKELIGDDSDDRTRPGAMFGHAVVDLPVTEIQSVFKRPVALGDVRMIWVRWVLCRWVTRCTKAAIGEPRPVLSGLGHQGPLIWFTPHMDASLRGTVGWCQRRGGVPLNRVEKLVLQRAFRFRKVTDNA